MAGELASGKRLWKKWVLVQCAVEGGWQVADFADRLGKHSQGLGRKSGSGAKSPERSANTAGTTLVRKRLSSPRRLTRSSGLGGARARTHARTHTRTRTLIRARTHSFRLSAATCSKLFRFSRLYSGSGCGAEWPLPARSVTSGRRFRDFRPRAGRSPQFPGRRTAEPSCGARGDSEGFGAYGAVLAAMSKDVRRSGALRLAPRCATVTRCGPVAGEASGRETAQSRSHGEAGNVRGCRGDVGRHGPRSSFE